MSSLIERKGASGLVWLGALLLLVTASAASAETLLMPKRDYLAAVPEVVWGITTQANGTAYVLDYGDGSAQQTGNVVDRSYIAFQHTFPAANDTYTVRLCVGAGAIIPGCPGELASVQVNVFNGLVGEALRNLNVNRAIQDGLRYLWTSQSARTTFDTTAQTTWGNFVHPFTSLVVLAFENQGYRLPNDQTVPTGLYEKYAVQRGLNYVIDRLRTTYNSPNGVVTTLGLTPQGDNPCVGPGIEPVPCVGLFADDNSDSGYESSLAILPLSAAGAPTRMVAGIPGTNSAGFVVGKTYKEILQRQLNALAWGQIDNNSTNGKGGWWYDLNSPNTSDGSTIGWNMLALFDAVNGGAILPPWVQTQWNAPAHALVNHINTDGSFDYQADANPNSNNSVNVAKTGVGLQGMFFGGRPAGDSDVTDAKQWISDRWTSLAGGQSFICGNSTYNKGCAYGMFNVFKGLKVYAVQTLPGVGRAAGPGAIVANDWYADYVDWLIANQTAPTTTAGGNWGPLYFSSQTTNEPAEAAIAELILAPVALVLPDPDLFRSVGLSQLTDTNVVGSNHTVTAFAQSASGSGVQGALINFVVQGTNPGAPGGVCAPASCVTGADGKVSFTYPDTNGLGNDTIQAFIGQLGSNTLTKHWVNQAVNRCDTDNNGVVNMTDLINIRSANGQMANGPSDPRDGNGDMSINVADLRYCQLRLTPPAN